MNRLNFTKAAVAALTAGEGGRRVAYYDTRARGLCVLVAPRTKSFYVLRFVAGKAERVFIGRFPDTTIEQARERAGKINSQIDGGANPNEVKRERRRELTLDQLHAEYMKRHAEIRNRRPDNAMNNYRRYLSHWGRRKLTDITRRDVAALHADLARDVGQVTANIALTLLRAMYNRASEWDLWEGVNPTTGVRKFAEKSRERFILPDEMPRFHGALRHVECDTTRDFILMLLLTGARRGNVMEMRWRDVDLERAVWRIPETKSGDPHAVALSPEAVAVLSARRESCPGEFVFPGPGKTGHLEEPKRAWAGLLLRAELIGLIGALADLEAWPDERRDAAIAVPPGKLREAVETARAALRKRGGDPERYAMQDLRIHDLRRTHGSWMAANGASLPMIGKALGHKNPSTTAIYARLNLDPVREAINGATAAMFEGAGDLIPASKADALGAHEERKRQPPEAKR